MVHVNVNSVEAMTQMEMSLAANLLYILCTNEELRTGQTSITSDDLTMTRHIVAEDGSDEPVETIKISRETFVSAVQKGMNSTLDIRINTYKGEEYKSLPFMPVTLVDMPILNKAMVSLDAIPDFLPKFQNGKLGFLFRNELLDFVQRDIDEDN